MFSTNAPSINFELYNAHTHIRLDQNSESWQSIIEKIITLIKTHDNKNSILLGDFNINDCFKKSFTEYLMSNDICIDLLRVYEASLFLSMIPLHQDNNYSMLRFADACDNILKGVNF